jgi:hypothetical protein
VEDAAAPWICYHLYYHQDLNRAVRRFVHPTVAALHAAGWIDGFFFIRYGLGGPHVRLRLLPKAGRAAEVAASAEARARDFLAELPSISTLDMETLRRAAEALVAADPYESDATVYPDNSFLAFPFRPETERYGGPERLADSLGFFAVSSAVALDFLLRHGEQPRSRQLAVAFSLMVRQALCFARDEEELIALARYGVDSWGGAMPAIVAKADRVFAEQGEGFRQLFGRELAAMGSIAAEPPSEAAAWLPEASRRLSQAIGEDLAVRRKIGISQLHMAANRLGLSNPEEVYLSRILSNRIAEALAAGAETGAELREALATNGQRRPAGTPDWRELLSAAMPAVGEGS